MQPQLTNVPETMLWTLHNRASEAMRSDGIIDDDNAVSIYTSIDYDYEKSFGKPEASHAVRSLDFDRAIRDFLRKNPNGTIVNLGEGLETQRFRVADDQATWFSVDLPEAIAIREQFIQPDDRHQHIAFSALDRRWFDFVDKSKAVFISAQGLFMYFTESEVKDLLQDIEATFERWVLMFDTIPIWLSNKTLSEGGWAKTNYYVTPKMPWGINRSNVKQTIGGWLKPKAKVADIGYSTFPRGLQKWVFSFLCTMPGLKNHVPTIIRLSTAID